ncbi:MAG TPA: hypothetical protein VHS96_15505 [Bacteroidia bacterium]|nr:hypothetical protein [Bacteroidia bacterium]
MVGFLRNIGWLMLALLACRPLLPAQGSYAQRLTLEVVRVPAYKYATAGLQPFTYPMGFADHRINKADLGGFSEAKFKQIDLVFTLYPQNPENWKVGYDSLMERRFRTLERRIPKAFQDPEVKWRLVIQTQCQSLEEAKAMFHGFVLYPDAPSWTPTEAGTDASLENMVQDTFRYDRFDTVLLREKFSIATKIISGEKVIHDSTVIKVWERHPEWKNALVVVDWTASMYKQGALLVRWQQEHLAESRIRHLVFFNDGDQKFDQEKVIGATGGIYEAAADSLRRMMAAIEAVTMGGDGGDHRENNLEAVLEGLASCPDCEQVILIADNTGPVRDMSLLELVDLPVRVLLCGVYKDEIETDYLQIVAETGGSLHTRDRDISDLTGQLVKGILTIGDKQYTKKGKRWVKYEPRM